MGRSSSTQSPFLVERPDTIKAAAQTTPKAKVRLPGGEGRRAKTSLLAAALAKAVGLRTGGRNRPSLHMKAPDTGGRSFHFEHSTVTKGEAATVSKRLRQGGWAKPSGTAGAHLAYIERETAVEKLQRIEKRSWERGPDLIIGREQLLVDMPKKRGRPTKEDVKLREKLASEATREAGTEIGEGKEADARERNNIRDRDPSMRRSRSCSRSRARNTKRSVPG